MTPEIEEKPEVKKPNRFLKFLKFFSIFSIIFLVIGLSIVYGFYYKNQQITKPTAILVLGKGGEGHTAPNLTDTIMLVNFNNSSKKINILSLPRDIWITEIRAKLNSAYHYGGFKMATDSVKSITGVPADYTVVVDFSLFKDLIDSIGGIAVNVTSSFVDEKYPIAGLENDLCNGDKTFKCRYETLSFLAGKQNMSGDLALKFVRSRNAVGDEGTDLARELRQQAVISAIKEKLLSREVFLNPKTIKKLYEVFTSHIETDLDKNTTIALLRFSIESKFNINFLSIPEETLKISQGEAKYDKQYVFVPKSGTWKELQEWVKQKI